VLTKANDAVRLLLPSIITAGDIFLTAFPKLDEPEDAVLLEIKIKPKPDFGADAIEQKMTALNPDGKYMFGTLLQKLLEGILADLTKGKAPLMVDVKDINKKLGSTAISTRSSSPLGREPWYMTDGVTTTAAPKAVEPCRKATEAMPSTTTPMVTVPCTTSSTTTEPIVEFAPCAETTTVTQGPCAETSSTLPPTTWRPVMTTPCPEDIGIRPKPCDISGRNNWIIKLPDDWTDEQIRDLSLKFASRDKYEGHPSQRGLPILIVWAGPEELAKAFHASPGVEYVEQDSDINCLMESEDYEVEPTDVNQRLQLPWSLDRLDSEQLDNKYIAGGPDGGRGAHVYVMDTGIRTTHAQFGGRAVPAIETTSSQVKVCSSTDIDCAFDGHGHGTHVAGAVGGSTYGVSQGTWLHAVKTLTDECKGSMASFLIGLDWILAFGERPAVIAAALNGTSSGMSSRVMKDAILKAGDSGVTVVVGAGDDATNACSQSPAYVPSAITVAATNEQDELAKFSNYGTCVDILAPGANIKTAGIKSDVSFAVVSGTSMAVANTAGAVAMMLSIWNALSAKEVAMHLVKNAVSDVLHLSTKLQSPNKLLSVKTGLGLQEVVIGPSDEKPGSLAASPASTQLRTAKYRKKCVKAPAGIRCAVNAGDYGQRLGHDEFKDAFTITVEGSEVCAQRIDNYEDDFLVDAKYSAGMYDEGGWLLNLRILCHWKSVPASTDIWGFLPVGGNENAVCAADSPVDRKSIYTAIYHNISKVEACQELCEVHQGCKGFSLLNEQRCEVWLKNIKSYVLMPKKMATTNPVRCMKLLGRGNKGSGVIRLASRPLLCLQAVQRPNMSNGPTNFIQVRDCDTNNQFQQFTWTGVGSIYLTSAGSNCVSAAELLIGSVRTVRMVLQSCGQARGAENNETSQIFSFAGSGLLRWAGDTQDWCVTSKVSGGTPGKIYPEIVPCDKTDPDQQFFY